MTATPSQQPRKAPELPTVLQSPLLEEQKWSRDNSKTQKGNQKDGEGCSVVNSQEWSEKSTESQTK